MKMKFLNSFTVLAALLCVAARTVTLLYATETKTGFFISRLMPLGISLCIAIFTIVLIATAFAFTIKEGAKNEFAISKLSGSFFIITGIVLLSYSLGFGTHAYALFWQHILEVLSGAAAGVWFVLYGLGAFTDKIKLPKVFCVLPAVHWVMRLVVVFATFSTTALVAEHIFSLSSLCLTTLFMLFLGKALSGVAGKKTLTALYPTAVCASLLNLTSSLSRLVVTLVSQAEKIHGEVPLDIVGIIVGIFMLVLTADMNKANKKTKTEENENEI